MLPRTVSLACGALGLLILGSATGLAAGGRKPPQIPMDPFSADGTVQAVAPGRIQILTNSNQNWLIWIDPKAKIRVTGAAEADVLRVGMFVKLTAEFDGRGQAREKVGDLTLITPTAQEPVGAWPEGKRGDAEDEQEEPSGRPPRTGRQTFAAYTVAGRITGLRKGRLTVHCGRGGVFRCELSEQPRIKVDFADYTVAQKDSKISITQGKMPRGTFGVARASVLNIKLNEPLTWKKKRPIRNKRTPSKRPADDVKDDAPK